ncbi:39S ribosomal protein L41, mitochondrial isoform X2 [Schistocerca americana]|uniref:39S ribosomal protein L41, mitochondrial isoform X2 n=1 Tax=Schistocerca americana TaxID=7009 RepID=UPI001F4F3A28|nr:39S ribosomal protein L41, mitochondrial isoform X2 [Schistocerca americana]XP_049961339.1 39S ribosomal protein L41, mitochondrial isoform X2 [Schistocerca serialis cubense]
MASNCVAMQCRFLSLSSTSYGKRNFRKFLLHNKRGTRLFKKAQTEKPDPDIPIYHYGVRPIGYKKDNRFIMVPEMIPELVVPDLTNFKLKPYVSYAAPDVIQSEFTARDLFDAVYRRKIVEDFKNGKLDSSGNPLEPSPEEALTADEAKNKARSVGNDICGELPRSARE